MKIMIVAGGTKGHISPALIFAKELKKDNKDVEIYFVATTKDQKYQLEQEKYLNQIIYLEAYGMSKNLKKWNYNFKCYQQIKKMIIDNHIDKVIGFGGYISGISLYAAKKCKVYTFLHEQNSIMGKANRYAVKFVNQVFLSYPINNFNSSKMQIVGNPVYLEANRKKQKIYKEKNTILFTSGSLGAKVVNDLAIKFLKSTSASMYKCTIITGERYYSIVKQELVEVKNAKIYSYTNNLIDLLASSMIVVTRAGASTLFEIMGVKTVPIIIPSINVTENHQYYNATYFTNKYMGELLEEKDLSLDNFLLKLALINNNYDTYLEHINSFDMNNTITKMVNEVLNETNKHE